MKKVILYSAISLDGKIAKEDGDVAWLDDIPNPDQLDYGYADFYDSIDTTLMGNKTYELVLSFDIPFPYPDKKNYVFTRNLAGKKSDDVEFISSDILSFIQNLKAGEGKNIWLVGGAEINTLLLNNNLIDEMILHVMPVVLGTGIPLFSGSPIFTKLELTQTENYSSGVAGLTYKIKH